MTVINLTKHPKYRLGKFEVETLQRANLKYQASVQAGIQETLQPLKDALKNSSNKE